MGGGGGGSKNDPPFFGSKIMNLLVFFDFEPKSVSGSRLHRVCMGRSGTSAHAVYALFSHFGMLAVLATSVTPWYPLRGVRVGML